VGGGGVGDWGVISYRVEGRAEGGEGRREPEAGEEEVQSRAASSRVIGGDLLRPVGTLSRLSYSGPPTRESPWMGR
jgi:hypothetical protein